MENNTNLDRVISEFNELGNMLEEQYLGKREEKQLELVITHDNLNTILLGTACIDNHRIAQVIGENDRIILKLEKI